MISKEEKLELFRKEIVEAFGTTLEELICLSAITAIHELHDENLNDPVMFIEEFIDNCSEEQFSKLKNMRAELYESF